MGIRYSVAAKVLLKQKRSPEAQSSGLPWRQRCPLTKTYCRRIRIFPSLFWGNHLENIRKKKFKCLKTFAYEIT